MFDIHSTSAAAYLVLVEGETFRFGDANEACLAMTGMVRRFVPGLTPDDVFPELIAEQVKERFETCRDGRQAITHVSTVDSPSGPRTWRTMLVPQTDAHGRVVAICGFCAEVDEPSSELPRRADFDLALGAIEGGFWIYEMDTGAFETSRPLAELIAGPGTTTLNLTEYVGSIHADDLRACDVLSPCRGLVTIEYRVIAHDGRTRWLRSKRKTIRDDAGKALRIVGVVADITEQKTTVLMLERMASTDSLTKLSNRRAFDRAATLRFRAAKAKSSAIAVVLVDLDGFKDVNDRHGHAGGDEILRKVARRLERLVREGDLVARFGGDEFAIVLADADTTMLGDLLARLKRAFGRPITLDGETMALGASFGAATQTAADHHVAAVVARADMDLYADKRQRALVTA